MSTIKLLAMDVDGTLTNGKINITNTGELFKAFDVKDGYAIKHLLPLHGIKTAIITSRKSNIVSERAKELNISYIVQSSEDKVSSLRDICLAIGISLRECAYIGDDLNDIPLLKVVGLSGCPNDAVSEVRESCQFISSKTGGNGAVREFCEYIIKKKGNNTWHND